MDKDEDMVCVRMWVGWGWGGGGGGGGGGEHSGGEPNPGPPVDDSVLCGPLQGLFFTTRNCW